MARITVEDCLRRIDNRFDLVVLAAHRARALSAGATPLVSEDRDKTTVIALREIGDGVLSPRDLRESFITHLQRYLEVDEPEGNDSKPKGAILDDGSRLDSMEEQDLLRAIERLGPPPQRDSF